MYTIPQRLTVAGDAMARLSTSNKILIPWPISILSPLARHNTCHAIGNAQFSLMSRNVCKVLVLKGKQRHWERGFTYHLCIIQYGVKVFNPECIHRSVHHNPVPKNGRLLSVNVTGVFCRGRCFNWRRNNLSAFQKKYSKNFPNLV